MATQNVKPIVSAKSKTDNEELSDTQLLAIVEAEFMSAMGRPDSEISAERAKAWNFYLGKPLGNEIEGQSQVVSNDVAEVVDSILPSLLRIFTVADNLVSFDPVNLNDEALAAQESDYVNHVFFKENDAFAILHTWFLDALIQKNGVVKAYWEKSEHVTTEKYEGLTEDELSMLLDDPDLEATGSTQRTISMMVPQQTMLGMMPMQQQVTVYDVTFKRTCKYGKCCVEPVPPEQYRISGDARSLDPSKARMVGQERDDVTRTELLEMGFDPDVVDKLPAHNVIPSTGSSEKTARYDKADEQEDMPSDRSMDKILLRECYIKVDYDGDGIAELRQVYTAGNEVLSNELVDRQCFHVLTPQILPHKHFGRATAEKVMDIQEVQTTLLRQTLTNLYHTNNPGTAVWEQGIGENTLDDLLTTRAGRVVRFNRPVSDSWAPMSIPFTAQATFPMFEYYDKLKRDRTGISSDAQGLSPDALKNIQTSVLASSVDMSRMKIEAIARIFAETGIRSLFMHIHELLQKHQEKEEVVKLRGDWVPINPAEWRERKNMTVNIGLGVGTREQNLLHLNAIADRQEQIIQGGGMNLVVTPKNLFNTMTELVKNANLKVPEKYFTDPGDKLQPPPSDEQAKLQAQQQQLEQRRQQLDAVDAQQKQHKLELQAQDTALTHQRAMSDLEAKYKAEQDKMVIEMEKIRNAITEMDLKYNTPVPGSRV